MQIPVSGGQITSRLLFFKTFGFRWRGRSLSRFLLHRHSLRWPCVGERISELNGFKGEELASHHEMPHLHTFKPVLRNIGLDSLRSPRYNPFLLKPPIAYSRSAKIKTISQSFSFFPSRRLIGL